MKLSLVTTVFNRKQQFLTTLRTIALTQYPHNDFDVTVIDDASNPDQKVDDLVSQFDFKMNLIVIKPEEKVWQEPIALINKAIRQVEGEIVIYQNAECCHVGDIISYAINNVSKAKYLSFGCFRVTLELSEKIQGLEVPSQSEILNIVGNPPAIYGRDWREGSTWWYNHSHYRPVGYYFCAAMVRQDYLDIGGIDERFQDGIFFADNEFMLRVNKRMEVIFVDDPFVIHQHHINFLGARPNYRKLKRRNHWLYNEIAREEW